MRLSKREIIASELNRRIFERLKVKFTYFDEKMLVKILLPRINNTYFEKTAAFFLVEYISFDER